MITLHRFRQLERDLRRSGFRHIIDWSEQMADAADADDFAARAIYVICNSGMRATVARPVYERCLAALGRESSATAVFGHRGKATAIDQVWAERERLYAGYRAAIVKLDFLAGLPWIGPVTKHHLAKNLGADTAKPDVHLTRLANRDRTTVLSLCRRLARLSGYRVATVDTILWRACADGVLNSQVYETEGWRAAYRAARIFVPGT
jgi:hypothetical protein